MGRFPSTRSPTDRLGPSVTTSLQEGESASSNEEEDNEEEDIVAIDDVEDNIEIKLTNGNGSMSSAAMQIGKYLVPRENCNKIIKVSENTVKRIKDLKKDKYEAIGDVVRRLCEGAKK